MRYFISALLTVVVLICGAAHAASPAFHAVDLQGKAADPFQGAEAAIVLVFLAVDCPISNKYAPELRRLSAQFAAQHIAFWFVYPDKDNTTDQIAAHVRDLGLNTHVLWDPHHALVKKAYARTTPEAAVFTSAGVLAYHGQIDNRFVALGQERAAPTRFPLKEALEAILQGQSIPVRETKAVGCPISD